MSLPTKTKTWQYNVNQTVGGTGNYTNDYRTLLLAIKNSLKGFGSTPWIVVGSSNGVAAGLDGVDRWASTADIVGNSPGAAHSWMVLKQTGIGANFQLLIDCGAVTSPSTLQIVRLSVSPIAGYTGGTISAAPTATDQHWYGMNFSSFAGGLTAGDTILGQMNSPWTGKLHIMQSSDGQCTRVILMNTNSMPLLWIIDKVGQPVSNVNWSVPYVMTLHGDNNNIDVGIYTQYFRSGANASVQSSIQGGSPALAKMYMTTECVSQTELGTTQTFANDLDGAWPINSVGMFCPAGTGTRGRHGVFQDLWCGSVTNRNAAYPADTTRQFVQFRDLIMPWNGSVPLFA